MKTRIIIIVIAAALVLAGGCEIAQQTGNPGATKFTTDVGDTAEAASQIMSIVGLWWPPALGIGALLAGIGGTARKLKPRIAEARDEAELYAVTVEELVRAIEKLKNTNGEGWNILKREITMDSDSEDLIKAIKRVF